MNEYIDHVITRGETLTSIARRYNTTVQTLASLNGITDPDLIYAGETIRVPAPSILEPVTQTYTIVRGDTLGELARRFGTTVAELARLNGITDPDLIIAGETIRVPAASVITPETQAYTIVRGDTLAGIAQRFGTTIAELVRLNGIANPNLIYAGETIRVPATSAVTPETRTYTIVRGDTLAGIAQRFGTTVARLVSLNDIANPNLIYAGETLLIPASASGETTYTIRRGDTLWALARRFGTTVNAIASLNGITNPSRLSVGQVIRIP